MYPSAEALVFQYFSPNVIYRQANKWAFQTSRSTEDGLARVDLNRNVEALSVHTLQLHQTLSGHG